MHHGTKVQDGQNHCPTIISFMHTIHKCLEHIQKLIQAFSLTVETPTHEQIAVQNICTSRLGEVCG